MALQEYTKEPEYFAPCSYCESDKQASFPSTPTSTSADVKGITVNITEGPIGFGVTAVLPDLEEDDIVLQAEPGNVISISAERIVRRTVQKQGKNRTYSSTEETSEFLRRTLKLPESADLNRVNTTYENGVLTVLVAKREDASGQADPQPVIMLK